MKLGSSRSREQHKRRRRITALLLKIALLGGAAFAIGGYAWQTASEVMRKDVESLTARASELQDEVTGLKTELAEHKATQTQLAKQLPNKDEQKILEAARLKIGEGVTPSRITEVVSAATVLRNCDNAPTSRRLRVRTAMSGSDSTTASFADNTITVSAEGAPSLNATGQTEAWFDNTKPISITFMHLNGAAGRAQGSLPLSHAIAVAGYEYRFQVQEGPRSFIVVTMDRCKA
ncbi:hypothetical protein [Govanella unica]|uniref:Uncharacterized protein n=1 Tax=Govanella unica TaxID=2975056 RepID=A0A9X3TVV4_9PROT|nr:hypothetical protein [Govania unica]MDA5192965.1 hypothetical protein [Govania unica]